MFLNPADLLPSALMAGPRDLYSFRRMLIVLLATVVAPVVMLSAVGFVAVKNERAAIERDVSTTFHPRLDRIALELARQKDIDERDPQQIADRIYGVDGTRYRLEKNDDASSLAVLSVRLAPPHDGWQIGVYQPLGQSVNGRLIRNRVLYVGLITIFFAAVVTGVSITGRAYYLNMKLARLQTDFVSNVSHELRTPLTSIRMFIDTLRMDRARDPAQVKECLDLLALESERLSNMIERMLSWARMEAGRRVYTIEATPVRRIVDGAVAAFRAQRLGAPYQLSVDVPEEAGEIDVDGDALTEALLNLLSNAFKYTGDDKKIRLRAYVDAESTVFEVEDNGIGIGPRDRKRIFDKFYRAEQLLSRKTEGTGLGLSMVRHIIEEGHRGRIECDSEPGKGSRFRMRLKTPQAARARATTRATA